MEEVLTKTKETIISNLNELSTLMPGSEEAETLWSCTDNLLKTYLTANIDLERLDLEGKKVSYEREVNLEKEENARKSEELKARDEKRNFWIKVADITARVCMTTMASMFNAAVFQHLLNFERDSTVGSTSTKTFLRGGLNIFKTNQM